MGGHDHEDVDDPAPVSAEELRRATELLEALQKAKEGLDIGIVA